MPTSKHRKQRRAYVPTERRIPVILCHNGAAECQLMLVPHEELEKLRTGSATEESWHTLAFRINVGQALAVAYFTPDVREALSDAAIAVSEVGKRYLADKRLGVTGDQFRAIARGLTITDDLQKITTRREQLAAHEFALTTAQRVPAGEVFTCNR
ncbi:hypothetical protein [Pandoraea terrigena]|uniref:Uncharacterized protein n=1 Tax=Pandoraea terrigena TaxID=2508292 RepID=A0A5E4YEA8_9BURK|nr:hypothetical protein [Pandoraea terrigena]VVE46782.1 hypothetical protein PTE31013_04481 [Pandoraea terrigena]